jgi:hypothetical protein
MMDTILERHYTIQELAKKWHFGVTTVRRWVDQEPDVVRYRAEGSKSTVTRVPESVARRLYAKMTAPGAQVPVRPSVPAPYKRRNKRGSW